MAQRYIIHLTLSSLVLLLMFCRGGTNNKVESLIKTERAFSQLSAEEGIRTAFLTFLADDALIFRPRPVLGKPLYEGRPNRPEIRLTWKPAWAAVAQAADIGFTTGPWELAVTREGETKTSYGHYVTIWKKQSSGPWRAAIDLGIDHEKMPPLVGAPKTTLPAWRAAGEIQMADEIDLIRRIDGQLYATTSDGELAVVYLKNAEPDVWLLRDQTLPCVGIQDVAETLRRSKGIFSTKVDTAVVSLSADLGYAFGTIRQVAADSGEKQYSYLHIWRKDDFGNWRIALDIALAIE